MPATRQLAAIMFTDMVGYTALMQQNETLAKQVKDRSYRIFENSLSAHQGKLLMNYGDGSLSIFTSALEAVRCAIEIQTLNRQSEVIDMRIGMHLGDVMFDETGIYGDSVNIASRIESLATPGAVFISEKLHEEIRNQSIEAKPLGYFELKNVLQPVNVYAVSAPGIVVPSREEVKGKVKQTLNSIAVLPFSSLSSDPENEFFCDGITEELLNVLAKVDGLQVTSRTSSFAFKGKNEDVREIAAKLNVQKILEGSVRKAGNKVRITAQLINAADGYHLWSETYDRSLEDIFAVQDDIARAIANKMRENLNAAQHTSQLAKASTQNLEAYKKYLQAVQFFNRTSLEDRKRAIELLQEVTELDAGMADAWALLSYIHSFFAQSGQAPAAESMERARTYAARAMELDPQNTNALTAISMLKLHAWEFDECRLLMKKARQLNPNNPQVLHLFCEYNIIFMEEESILEDAGLMLRLDPLSAVTVGQAARYYAFLGHVDEAMRAADTALQVDSLSLVSRNAKVLALTQKGEYDQALQMAEDSRGLAGDLPFVLLALAYVRNRRGETDKAREFLEKFERMHNEKASSNLEFVLALCALLAGEMGKFYAYYDEGMQKKSLYLLQTYDSEFMRDAWFDNHVQESRRKLGLPVKGDQIRNADSQAG